LHVCSYHRFDFRGKTLARICRTPGQVRQLGQAGRLRQDGIVSESAEQGVTPQDPADQAGIGGGIVPDDQGEGWAQVEELRQHPAAPPASGSEAPGEGTGGD
jgi:hypothetical protein